MMVSIEEREEDTRGAGKGHVKMQAEIGVMQPQPRDVCSHQKLEETGRIPP